MAVYLRVIVIVVLLAIVGALAFLVTWDIPPPTGAIEKVLPNERFPE